MERIRSEIPPVEEIDRLRDARPNEHLLKIALMVTRPDAAIGPNVACVLKAEIEWLQMRLKLEELQVKNHAVLVALLLGMDATKTIAALQAWERVLPLVEEFRNSGELVCANKLEAALKDPRL